MGSGEDDFDGLGQVKLTTTGASRLVLNLEEHKQAAPHQLVGGAVLVSSKARAVWPGLDCGGAVCSYLCQCLGARDKTPMYP